MVTKYWYLKVLLLYGAFCYFKNHNVDYLELFILSMLLVNCILYPEKREEKNESVLQNN
jgi:hypothetical protein